MNYENYIEQFVEKGYSPVKCCPQTADSRKQIVQSLIRLRSTMITIMQVSDQENENDPFLYTGAAIFQQKLTRTISKASMYYFYMLFSVHPQIDVSFKKYLDSDVKSDSMTPFNLGNDKKSKKKNKQ